LKLFKGYKDKKANGITLKIDRAYPRFNKNVTPVNK
jgi:hypothetical protein